MRRMIIIISMVLITFLIELVLFNFFGKWLKPNLLVILIVFMNLYLGVRYSLATAIMAGILKDCFTVNLFGINIFSFIICAYMMTFIRRYYYEVGSIYSRTMAIFLISLINVILHYILNLMIGDVDFGSMVVHILFPEVLTTVIVASFIFNRLKLVALKLSL